MHSLEKVLNTELSGNANEFKDPIKSKLKPHEKTDSSSIVAVFTEQNRQEVLHENENVKRANLNVIELDQNEIKQIFYRGYQNIHTAYRYIEDTHMFYDLHMRNRNESVKREVDWRENCQVAKILVTRDSLTGEAKIAGVVTHSGEYIYGTHLHMSGGYRVAYDYDPNSKTRFQTNKKVKKKQKYLLRFIMINYD